MQPGEVEMPEDPRLRNNLYPARPAMVIDQAKRPYRNHQDGEG